MAGSWTAGLREDLDAVFVKDWSPYLGALVVVGLVLALMVNGLFWGVFGGLKLWGQWINHLIGLDVLLGAEAELDDPLMHHLSLTDIALVIGAFSAALLSRRFALNRAPRIEYVWGALGGVLMGVGASLAGGCTVGGFFTPMIFASPAGWTMLAGLTLGALIGLKMLTWTLEHVTWGMQAPGPLLNRPALTRWYPALGVVVMALVLLWSVRWTFSGEPGLEQRALLVLCGFGLGFTLNRARLCFSRVVREPLMTGEGEMTKAVILAIAVGMPLASLLFRKELIDPYLAIPATFWLGSLLGGTIFGIGMIFAGGCASGSLWRMGEGHLKLWVAAAFFGWSGATFGAIAGKWGLLTREMNLDLIEETMVGYQAFLPAMLGGWGPTYATFAALLAAWYLIIRYNESTERLVVV